MGASGFYGNQNQQLKLDFGGQFRNKACQFQGAGYEYLGARLPTGWKLKQMAEFRFLGTDISHPLS